MPSPSASWMFILASMHVTIACSTITGSEGQAINRARRAPPTTESTCLIRAQLSTQLRCAARVCTPAGGRRDSGGGAHHVFGRRAGLAALREAGGVLGVGRFELGVLHHAGSRLLTSGQTTIHAASDLDHACGTTSAPKPSGYHRDGWVSLGRMFGALSASPLEDAPIERL